jgi:methylaspartate ammonia-lyase
LALADGFVAWGECVSAQPFSAKKGTACIENLVQPCLVGQSMTSFHELATKLDGLMEAVTITETSYPHPTMPAGPSRREVLRGQWEAVPAAIEPVVEQYEVKRPIHAAIRYGVSQAILQAVAHGQQKSPIQVLRDEYGVTREITAVPLHAEINPHMPLSIQTITDSPITSVGYTISGSNPVAELGAKGEVLQRFVRELKEQLVPTADPAQLTFHFNVRGGYGRLCDNNLGQILGMLYGLEKTAEPFRIRVEDPLLLDNRDQHIKKMAELTTYLQLRQMSLQLVAHQGIDSAADATTFIDSHAAHMLHLDLPQMGRLDEAITAVLACQDEQVDTLLGGTPTETQLAAHISTQLALALQPTLLLAKPGYLGEAGVATMHNQMVRQIGNR